LRNSRCSEHILKAVLIRPWALLKFLLVWCHPVQAFMKAHVALATSLMLDILTSIQMKSWQSFKQQPTVHAGQSHHTHLTTPVQTHISPRCTPFGISLRLGNFGRLPIAPQTPHHQHVTMIHSSVFAICILTAAIYFSLTSKPRLHIHPSLLDKFNLSDLDPHPSTNPQSSHHQTP